MLYPILGYRVPIALDPTDLIALVILFPAWRLWHQPTTRKPDARAWLMLSVASLAALATSSVPYARVVRVMAENQVIYARLDESTRYEQVICGAGEPPALQQDNLK